MNKHDKKRTSDSTKSCGDFRASVSLVLLLSAATTHELLLVNSVTTQFIYDLKIIFS